MEVRPTPAPFAPTRQADEQVASALNIPIAYLRRLREERPDLYDENVNGWLHGRTDPDNPEGPPAFDADSRSFLLRLFRGNGGPGVARAMLSSKYKAIDHMDVLTAALDGVREAGVKVDIVGCDLTDRKMHVRLTCPEIAVLAPALLDGYRSPFTNRPASEHPVVWAGLVLSNSETGGGAFTVAPRMVVEICSNGMKRTADAIRAVHLGSKLDEGVIDWSAQTMQRTLALITSKATDAVRTFLSEDYVRSTLEAMEARAATPITDPVEAVKVVTSRLHISEAHAKTVLDHFIKGGQLTAGGVAQAVSSVAQTLPDGDVADEMEAMVFQAVDVAASFATVTA